MSDHIQAAASRLRKRLGELEGELQRTRRALSALDSLGNKRSTGKRIRRVSFRVNCRRCDKPFKTRRNPKGKPSFCHTPCTSSMYLREEASKKAERKAKRKGQVLIPGDGLSVGH